MSAALAVLASLLLLPVFCWESFPNCILFSSVLNALHHSTVQRGAKFWRKRHLGKTAIQVTLPTSPEPSYKISMQPISSVEKGGRAGEKTTIRLAVNQRFLRGIAEFNHWLIANGNAATGSAMLPWLIGVFEERAWKGSF